MTGYDFTPTRLLVRKELTSYEAEHVSGIYSKDDLKETIGAILETMDIMCLTMLALALFLSVVVLYNMGQLSYTERKKELSTLKVIGFKSHQIRMLLLKQNVWISLIGVAIGTPLGLWLLQVLCDSSGDAIDITAKISPLTFCLSFVITFGVSLLVSLLFSKRVKKLDMVVVLKGIG